MMTLIGNKSALGEVGYVEERQLSRGRELVFYTLFDLGTTAGQVTIEGAHDAAFTGTWASLSKVNWAAGNRVHHTAVTGVHAAVRVRVSIGIANGTVSVYAIGN